MSEYEHSPEVLQVTREQVIHAYMPFVENGTANPDDLDLKDEAVIKANELFENWMTQEDEKVKKLNDLQAEQRLQYDVTTLYLDAGFTDPTYVEDVANDFLLQELDTAIESENDELAQIIRTRIIEINKNLPNPIDIDDFEE